MRKKSIKNITVIGLGLIGGSIALALKSKQKNIHVTGIDKDQRAGQMALKIKAIDKFTPNLKEGVKNAEIIFLAIPVREIIKILPKVNLFVKSGCLITDVGSTKQEIEKKVRKMPNKNFYFIGGHPMAGKEKSGISAAEANLFQDCIWCLITSSTKQGGTLERIIDSFGAKIITMDPFEHDNLVAGISHLPLVMAITLINTLFGNKNWKMMQKLAAGGLRDTTRIASGDPQMSLDIILTNKTNLVNFINKFIKELANFSRDIENLNEKNLLKKVKGAKKARDQWLQNMTRERSKKMKINMLK